MTFSSDWEAARDIMLEFAEESAGIVEQQARKEIHQLSREFLVHYSILDAFLKHERIQFAYPALHISQKDSFPQGGYSGAPFGSTPS